MPTERLQDTDLPIFSAVANPFLPSSAEAEEQVFPSTTLDINEAEESVRSVNRDGFWGGAND